MKKLLLFSFLLSGSLLIQGQNRSCRSLHKGKFKLTSEISGTTIITRTKKLQTEENADMSAKVVYYVNWVDDCTYELRVKEIVKGDPYLAGEKKDVVTVRIKEIKANSYIVESSSNFSDLVLVREIEIL